MYRPQRTAPLAAVLLFLLAASHAGVQLSGEQAVEEPVNSGDQIDGRAGAARVAREQSGTGNRQELHIGGQNGQILVEQVLQKQAGVGNRQVLSLGATDQ